MNLLHDISTACVAGSRFVKYTRETPRWVLMPMRDASSEVFLCDSPARAYEYWADRIATDPTVSTEVETCVVVFLNTRKRVKGHVVISSGTLDTLLVHPREVFRPAIVAGASAILLMHNHPSGDSMPSESDVKVTLDLYRAGTLLKIDVVDHVVVGCKSPKRINPWTSIREMGFLK